MNNEEKLETWKKKLIELEDKIKQINNHKIILINILNELNKGKNLKLNNLLDGIELKEEAYYLDDWVEFYKGRISRYRSKIKVSEKEIQGQKIEKLKEVEEKAKEQVKELFEKKGTWSIESSFKKTTKLHKNKAIAYGVPIILSLLIISVLFISKPEISGYVVLTQEKVNDAILNLQVNESGNYTWTLDRPFDIKSIKASGSVIGNGTVKIYIEKDGKRYLVYKNK